MMTPPPQTSCKDVVEEETLCCSSVAEADESRLIRTSGNQFNFHINGKICWKDLFLFIFLLQRKVSPVFGSKEVKSFLF